VGNISNHIELLDIR